jgi:tetratricopeptide (TPR) repeat protein/transcriptional regulator with XRE-family HTH domain
MQQPSGDAAFGALLRDHRANAGLTQEGLAERAGLSRRGIADLERAARQAPHAHTVERLAAALGLSGQARAHFEAAARLAPRARPGAPALSSRRNLPGVLTSSSNATGFGAGVPPRLVGRTREVEALRAKLQGALAERGGLVLLAGEPGIGKTRLLEELATEAEQRQMLVLWGRCWESEGAPPFWPWVEILRGVVHSRASAVLRAELGSGAPHLAELAPEVRERLPDLPAAPPLEASEARFRLFDSVTTALQNVSRSQPVLLVLDDLHWADKPSLLLLEFLLQYIGGARVLIVGSYRDTDLDSHHPLTEALGSLRRERAFDSMPLTGLTVSAVDELVNACLDQPLPSGSALAQALWHATEGNPLFVTEELRCLIQDNRLPRDTDDRDAGRWAVDLGLPQGVRDVIGRRLSQLPQTTNRLLTVAAVIGREFEVATLEQSSGLDERGMDAALDEAQTARVIEELPRTLGRYRFTHALFREALYAELPARRRMRLHGDVAQALERVYAHELDAHLAELAYHYGEAQAQLGTERLVHYSLLAGERALESKAYEEAAAHFQRGLDARPTQPMDGERAALLFGLGRAQSATLERPRAHEVVANLTRAFEYYADAGDVDRAVAVAEFPVITAPGQAVGAARLVACALALVEPDSHAAGRLLSRYATVAAIEAGDYQAAAQACDHALAIARREGDVRLEIQTLGHGAGADLEYLRWQDGLGKCLRAIDLASRADAPQAEMRARFFASIILWFVGDLAQGSEQAAALLARAEQLRDRRWLRSALWIAGTVARYRGELATARAYSERGLSVSTADARLLWTSVVLEHDVGDLATVNSLVARLLEVEPLSPPEPDFAQATTALTLASVPDAALAQDNLPLAEATAEAILSCPTATHLMSRISHASLALMALRRGDPAAIGRHYAGLETARGTILYESITGDRLLGLLARGMGHDSAAEGHFEDALRFCRNGGCRPELAWTCYDFAELLRGRGAPGDHDRASELLHEALAISRALRMRPLIERVLACRALLKT